MINQNLLLTGDAGYNLTKSLRFRSSASAYLNRTFGTPTSTTTWSLSFWLKRGNLTANAQVFSAGGDFIYFGGGTFAIKAVSGAVLETTQVFRDPSAWYHFLVVADTSNATANNRVRLYVNGTEVTAFSSRTNPSLSAATIFNASSSNNRIGGTGSTEFYDGYLAEINFVDGQALTPSSFGETSTTTGVWIPKKYTGTYGTNGFYLPFTDTTSTSTLGTDFSGNSNTWTVNNISLTSGVTYDSMTDVPTLTSATVANYPVLSPIDNTGVTISNANLTATTPSSNQACKATMSLPTTGKFYFEVTDVVTGGGNIAGIANVTLPTNTSLYLGTGSIYVTMSSNAVFGLAFNFDALTYTIYKNNSVDSTGSITSGITYIPFMQTSASGGASTAFNFGQRPFAYTPPTGFVALNTFNLPTPTIGATASTTANEYFDATIWTGDNTTPRSITNSGSMQPDFVWIKSRSNAYQNNLYDSVRGAGAAYALSSDSTNAEGGNSNVYGYLSAFNSTGFQVTQGTAGSGGAPNGNAYTNQTSTTYVAWQWRANGTAVTNTAGSITSTVSANTTAGFSIVTYTGNGTSGATVGHGLGVAPSMIIVKNRSATWGWFVYNRFLTNPNTGRLQLNLTNAEIAGGTPGPWNNTAPTSTVFSLGDSSFPEVNGSGNLIVAYCFAPIAGYSAFGSYTGNGSTDGPFVYTGFRPRFVLIKRTNAAESWEMFDSSRDTYNPEINLLEANVSSAEISSSTAAIDFLSNGFKQRNTRSATNGTSDTYIYMAFAESPFKYANAR